jgi:hypothetical protein
VTATAPTLGEILDDASELVARVAAPWAGLLWLTAAPLRLSQAHFAARLAELGSDASGYGNYLQQLAVLTAAFFLLSLWGRAAFARACARRLRGGDQAVRESLRVPAGSFASYVYAALAIEAAFYATALAVVTIPALALVAGLAAATSPLVERPSLVRPFAVISSSSTRVAALVGLLFVFGAALLLTAVNLLVLVQVVLWLAGGVAGFDVLRWQGVLGPSNPRLLLVVAAGSWLILEPWWLASLVVYVHALRARTSGEDLRLWFKRIRSAEA